MPVAILAIRAPAGLEVQDLEQRVVDLERVVSTDDLRLDRLDRAAEELPVAVVVANPPSTV